MRTDNLIINGYGSSNGGEFHKVQLNGKGTVNGNVECEQFECNGYGAVTGDLKSSSARISGSGKVDGTVHAETMRIDGKATITQDVKANSLKIAGKGTIGGNVTGEEFKVNGQATIDGLLSADEININIHGTCRAKEIGGQTIKVKHRLSTFSRLFKSVFGMQLEAELLEGDNIDIDYAHIRTVRGNNVTVGPNCEIELIEYTGVLTVDKSANVKEIKQI
ncbi:polymer-forming cytoskeletal protein [Bacillus thuringiensis]|uniref:Cytoplasmic protein n=1 Tax=Bacillus thuringiensis TaxID=1428 RepID=A0ABD6T0J9_BACTU|nr:polymer-forming cytoskeletal protein [Bacillus thuringiensis]PEX54550.1 cytoplasmic protein [Bacillus thuringiensis]